jgi:formylglycine-generating enzyme required for sulfatase activity
MRHPPKHLEALRELAYERPPDWRSQTRRLLRALYPKEAHFGTAWDYARGHALLEGVEADQVEREREAALGDGLWREPTLGLEMIWVPPGAFGRGWNPTAPDRLEGFSLARDPVTVTDFLHFVQATDYAPDARQLHPERYLGYADLGPELSPQERAAWLK